MNETNESQALVESFLRGTSEGVPQPDADDWHSAELPPGHKSGFVALIGRPNVGKSTLVNGLVGHKVAIVSPRPQTTRNRIIGILTQPQYQIIFVDTPGIHRQPRHRLNKLMIAQAVDAIPDANVIYFVVDVSVLPREEDKMIARLLRE